MRMFKFWDKKKNGFAYVGYDFGFVTSYNSIIYCYIDTERNNLYIAKEFYRNRMTDEEILQEPIMQELINDGDVVFGDSAEPKTIEFYRNNGVKMNPAEKNNHFLEFTHDYDHDQYILIGGYGSGKSYTTSLKIILLGLS